MTHISKAQKVMDCISDGVTDREMIADLCGIKKSTLTSTLNYLVATKRIEMLTRPKPGGKGKGSKPGTYRVVGATPVYRGTFSHVSSIFHVGANA